MRAAIYVRVSTREQRDSGLGLEAQKTRCLAEVKARGWDLTFSVDEQATSGKTRPKLEKLMRELDVGLADCLVVSRLDRLSRSFGEFGKFIERSQKGGWSIVILEPSIDLSTASGRMLAGILASVAQWEREIGAQRTKEGLAALRARGVTKAGKTYRPLPRYDDRPTIRRIVRLRTEKKMSLEAIAEFLTEAGVPSPHDVGRWNHRTIRKLLTREGVD